MEAHYRAIPQSDCLCWSISLKGSKNNTRLMSKNNTRLLRLDEDDVEWVWAIQDACRNVYSSISHAV